MKDGDSYPGFSQTTGFSGAATRMSCQRCGWSSDWHAEQETATAKAQAHLCPLASTAGNQSGPMPNGVEGARTSTQQEAFQQHYRRIQSVGTIPCADDYALYLAQRITFTEETIWRDGHKKIRLTCGEISLECMETIGRLQQFGFLWEHIRGKTYIQFLQELIKHAAI